MAAFFIESDNVRNLKLLTEIAEQLGLTVNKLSAPQVEDLHLGMLMKKEKTGKYSSRSTIMKQLDRK